MNDSWKLELLIWYRSFQKEFYNILKYIDSFQLLRTRENNYTRERPKEHLESEVVHDHESPGTLRLLSKKSDMPSA